MSGPAANGRDPGLQPERTRLAWRRTTLAATVAVVLALKSALTDGAGPPALLGCALCLGAWLGFLGVAHRRITALASRTGSPVPLAPRLAAAAAGWTVALALCGAAVLR
ncbi:DUF202 domain-containing protein [Streptomyces sp. SCSIO ZS0520]|uniref:DUF202 domain-containing protein n=1 Tax=Streptomyces sp. SCSIO ZS0520 TaxID=2892996 RepID=UPI0021DA317C|nr:DUF202 domain-containing protein [Streptomyces sp. SCSIO ZS0520]